MKKRLNFTDKTFVSTIAIAALLPLPLFLFPPTNHLGYGFSFLTALLLSLISGILAARYPERVRNQLAPFPGANQTLWRLLIATAAQSGMPVLAVLVIALVASTFIPQCNLTIGLLTFLLGPIASAIAATTCGLFLGLIFPGKKLPIIAWITVYVAFAGYGAYEMYQTPTVYVYGPFWGYFATAIYERSLHYMGALATYRVQNTVWVTALMIVSHALLNKQSLSIRFQKPQLSPRGSAALLLLAITLAGFHYYRAELGHSITEDYLKEQLPVEQEIPGAHLHFAPQISPRQRMQLLEDAEFSLYKIQTSLGTTVHQPLDIFIFSSRQQRKQIMDIDNTSIAKPWRGQCFVVADELPHFTLRHELVHLVSANFGRGPFRIAGNLGGIFPAPGIIEGTATALGGPRGDMSLHGYASALRKQQRLPSAGQLLGPGFFALTSQRAYIASGSLIQFVLEAYGQRAFHKLYESASVSEALNISTTELETRWHAFLDNLELSAAELTHAESKFAGVPTLATQCLHAVTKLQNESQILMRRDDCDGALSVSSAALEKSGNSTAASVSHVERLLSCNRPDSAHAFFDESRWEQLSPRQRLLLKEQINDAEGKKSAQYKRLQSLATMAWDQRRLFVKSHLATIQNHHADLALQYLSLLSPQTPISAVSYALHLRELFHQRKDPIAAYLLARTAFNNRSYTLALHYAQYATGFTAPPETIAPVTLALDMLKGKANFYLKQYDAAQNAFIQVTNAPLAPSGSRNLAQDWLDHIHYMKIK